MTKVVYSLVDGKNCARFTYHGRQRVVRVVKIEQGNVTGYVTRDGSKIVNKRFAPIKSFKIGRMKGGLLSLTAN